MLQKIQKGCVWLDTGTIESLAEAGELIKVLEKRQGYKIGCIEESALEMGLITKKDVKSIARQMSNSEYGKYLSKISRFAKEVSSPSFRPKSSENPNSLCRESSASVFSFLSIKFILQANVVQGVIYPSNDKSVE